MLITNTLINNHPFDVRIKNGKIIELGKSLAGQSDYHGRGNRLIPGLHDHHIHIQATAAAMNSLRCGPPEIHTAAELKTALNAFGGSGWIRGIGYHDRIGHIDRAWLDRNGPDQPIRIQHRSGRMWILNSLAIERVGNWVPDDGRLIDGDKKLRQSLQSERPDLKPLMHKLLSYGITGVTEVTPGNQRADYDYLTENLAPLSLSIMGSRELDGLPLAGPLKLHYHDYNLPSLAELTSEIANAHASNRPVAAHCVTLAELMLTLSAIDAAGVHPEDRIEHGAVITDEVLPWIKKLGLTVVTQPHFLKRRQETYLQDVDTKDHANLWRVGSLLKVGIPIAFGSDAPFEDFNPWEVMDAAIHRPAHFGSNESITPEDALNAYLKPADNAKGTPRQIEVGERADLCLIDEQNDVLATWVKGELLYKRSDDFIHQPPI